MTLHTNTGYNPTSPPQAAGLEHPPEAHAVPIDGPLQGSTNNSAGTTEWDCMLCGETKIRGIGSGRHISLGLCGRTRMDFRDCQLAPGTKIRIWNIRLMGSTEVLVPQGIRVVVRRIVLFGRRDINIDDDRTQDQVLPAPRLTITVVALFGDVRVRSGQQMAASYGGPNDNE